MEQSFLIRRRNSMANSFWTGGPAAYAKAIAQQYQQTLAELDAKLPQCQDDAERQEILSAIEAVKAEMKKKLRRIDAMDF